MDTHEQDGHPARLRLVIASDLHAYEGEAESPPSRLHLGSESSDPLLDPITGFEDLVSKNDLAADLVLCPGDLGDRAQRGGVTHGWKMLQRIASVLGDAPIVATTGNHDVTSRPADPLDDSDPVETLRGLEPRYPYAERTVQQAYFGDHYALVRIRGARVVTLNTSAHHGRGGQEYDYGRVSPQTRREMLADLTRDGYCQLNILLCHHHPIEYTPIDEPDRSSIVGGALLLQELTQKSDLGPWLVVHGHKHIPNLAYAPGSGNSAVVFSAGSLAASLHLDQQPNTRNQVYWLEFDFPAADALSARMLCRFRSWYWVPSRGWLPTDRGSGLPAEGGFGIRADPRRLATEIEGALAKSGKPALGWNGLAQLYPQIEFLIPDDLEAVAQELEHKGFGVELDANYRYKEVTRPWPITTE